MYKIIAVLVVALIATGVWYKMAINKDRIVAKHTNTVSVEQRLGFSIAVRPGCELGDMDVIDAVLKKVNTKKILVTMEFLKKNSKETLLTKEIGSERLYKGVTVDFELSGGEKHVYDIGVFLCTDKKKTNSCKRKKLLNMKKQADSLLERNRLTKNALSEGEDVVFLFQYIQLADGRLTFLTDKPGKDRADIARHLVTSGSLFDGVDEMFKKTTSLPLEIERKKNATLFRLALKKADTTVCTAMTQRKHREEMQQRARLRRRTK